MRTEKLKKRDIGKLRTMDDIYSIIDGYFESGACNDPQEYKIVILSSRNRIMCSPSIQASGNLDNHGNIDTDSLVIVLTERKQQSDVRCASEIYECIVEAAMDEVEFRLEGPTGKKMKITGFEVDLDPRVGSEGHSTDYVEEVRINVGPA